MSERRPNLGAELMAARVQRARELLAALHLDALLVSDLHDVRYLSGFRGEDTWLLIGAEAALICTDARFVPLGPEVVGFTLELTERLLDDAVRALARELGPAAAVGIQGGHLTYADHRRLRRLHQGRLRDVGTRVSALRAVKDAGEIATVRHAAEIADAALEAVLSEGLIGRTEAEVAWDLRAAMHGLGAEDVAFEAIVAGGERGALAHAIPGERRIAAGELVVIDCGARVDGYCSDITRTVAAGPVGDEERRVYDVVLQAQLAGLAAVRAGVGGRTVDAAARGVIDEAGFGSSFAHGTGHGVGLAVHEHPRLGRRVGDALRAGMIATVEPGIYLPGSFGVRIEDTVLVTDDGCERLTRFPKELRVVE